MSGVYDVENVGRLGDFERIVLCSHSPRRRELLSKYRPILTSAEADERAIEKKWMAAYGEEEFLHRAGKTACRLAEAKLADVRGKMKEDMAMGKTGPEGLDPAEAAGPKVGSEAAGPKVAAEAAGRLLYLACDTMVVHEGKIFNKPADHAEARRMLQSYLGREHQVVTGVAMETATGRVIFYSVTGVAFSKKTPFIERLVDDYVETGLPMDKAGAYGIQELDPALIEYICGDFYTIVGLPLGEIERRINQ